MRYGTTPDSYMELYLDSFTNHITFFMKAIGEPK
jgi:hypothetical protein